MRWALLIAIVACSKTADPSSDPAAKPSAEAAKPTRAKHEDRHEPAVAPAKLTLAITIGGAASTWTEAAFAGVPKLAGVASDGEARDTWSLRELAHRNAGPDARVIAVISADGKQPIEPSAWADAARTPILHTTRRGTLKFRWADKDGRWGETIVKDVTGLELTR
ncbi:MAG TPA: hypothetical protein VN253_26515 [Kofleriaceae bacterium]|nr:hypothetical protein [Kofleriaceae bacterium]